MRLHEIGVLLARFFDALSDCTSCW